MELTSERPISICEQNRGNSKTKRSLKALKIKKIEFKNLHMKKHITLRQPYNHSFRLGTGTLDMWCRFTIIVEDLPSRYKCTNEKSKLYGFRLFPSCNLILYTSNLLYRIKKPTIFRYKSSVV